MIKDERQLSNDSDVQSTRAIREARAHKISTFFEREFSKIKKNILISMPIYPRAFILDVNFAGCNLA